MTLKQKIANFWDYHKVHVFAGILALLFIAMGVSECMKNKTPDLSIGYISSDFRDYEKLEMSLSEALGDQNGDGNEYVFCDNVVINKTPQTDQDSMMIQKVTVMFISGEYRMYIMDKDFFEVEMYNEMFMDLTGMIDGDVLQNAYKVKDKPIAVKSTDCPFLKDIDFCGEELYVGLTAIAEPDKDNKNIDTEVETAKKALGILMRGQ